MGESSNGVPAGVGEELGVDVGVLVEKHSQEVRWNQKTDGG
jgi:hypothetical protein